MQLQFRPGNSRENDLLMFPARLPGKESRDPGNIYQLKSAQFEHKKGQISTTLSQILFTFTGSGICLQIEILQLLFWFEFTHIEFFAKI